MKLEMFSLSIERLSAGRGQKPDNVLVSGTLKKDVLKFLTALVALSLILAALHLFAANWSPVLESPQIVSCEQNSDSISFSWSAVPYATSYRIYKRSDSGQWHMVTVCSYQQQSFSESLSAHNFEYAVCACNVSGEQITLSEMSTVIETAGDIDG